MHADERLNAQLSRTGAKPRRFLVWLTIGALIGGGVGVSMRIGGITPVRVTTGSMSPTIKPGEWVVTSNLRSVHPGDIIEFEYPLGTTGRAIKRVAAVEGDEVVVTPRSVSVNGRETSVGAALTAIQPTTLVVPPGHVFLLGDNQAGSVDSRDFGAVPDAELVASVTIVPQPLTLATGTAILLAFCYLGYLATQIKPDEDFIEFGRAASARGCRPPGRV